LSEVEGPLQYFFASGQYINEKINPMKGFFYILKCKDGSYYCGSTKYLQLRIQQHGLGLGANHTKKRLPVYLVYSEEFDSVVKAYAREKQIQKWTRRKKEALIHGEIKKLHECSICKNDTHYSKNRDLLE
jgi:putative endonuclease